jgi:hypothetical protein
LTSSWRERGDAGGDEQGEHGDQAEELLHGDVLVGWGMGGCG